MDRPIALVVALAQERRTLQRSMTSVRRWRTVEFEAVAGRLASCDVVVIQAGIGRDRAQRALLTAAQQFPFSAVCSLGFAGGLTDALGPGSLVCPAVVLQDDGQTGKSFGVPPAHAVICKALSSAGILVHDGPLLTVDVPLRMAAVKRVAHQRTGAIAVDMEASGVVEAAQRLGIPWLAIKAVVDGVEEPLPGFLATCTTARGQVRWRRVLWSLVADGARRRTLRRLGQASRQAALALQRSLSVALGAWVP